MNSNQQLYVVTRACTNPPSDEPCPYKAGLKSCQNLFLIFPVCCLALVREDTGEEVVFCAKTAVTVFGDDIQN